MSGMRGGILHAGWFEGVRRAGLGNSCRKPFEQHTSQVVGAHCLRWASSLRVLASIRIHPTVDRDDLVREIWRVDHPHYSSSNLIRLSESANRHFYVAISIRETTMKLVTGSS